MCLPNLDFANQAIQVKVAQPLTFKPRNSDLILTVLLSPALRNWRVSLGEQDKYILMGSKQKYSIVMRPRKVHLMKLCFQDHCSCVLREHKKIADCMTGTGTILRALEAGTLRSKCQEDWFLLRLWGDPRPFSSEYRWLCSPYMSSYYLPSMNSGLESHTCLLYRNINYTEREAIF